jgi:hypothetical protein
MITKNYIKRKALEWEKGSKSIWRFGLRGLDPWACSISCDTKFFYVYPAASLCLYSLVPGHKVSGLVQITVLHLQVELARQEVRQLEEKRVKLLQIITHGGERLREEGSQRMGDGRIFQKIFRASLFNDDLSNEPNFGRIHLAGQYL